MAARRYKFITFVKWWQIRTADYEKFLFKAEIASFTWAIVGWAWWNDTPWNKVVNVLVFKSPDMFPEFGRVSVFFLAEWCSVRFLYLVLKSFRFTTYFLCILRKITWACDHLKTSNLSADNLKSHANTMGRYLSQLCGHLILVSGYPVLTAVNWPQHGCVMSGCTLPQKVDRGTFSYCTNRPDVNFKALAPDLQHI